MTLLKPIGSKSDPKSLVITDPFSNGLEAERRLAGSKEYVLDKRFNDLSTFVQAEILQKREDLSRSFLRRVAEDKETHPAIAQLASEKLEGKLGQA